MSIKVEHYMVTVINGGCDVDMEVLEYENTDVMLQELEQEFGEDIYGTEVTELWDDQLNEIIIEFENGFGKWKVTK